MSHLVTLRTISIEKNHVERACEEIRTCVRVLVGRLFVRKFVVLCVLLRLLFGIGMLCDCLLLFAFALIFLVGNQRHRTPWS